MRATRFVLIRDFIIYGAKLAMDAFKDAFLLQAAIVAVIIDLFFGGERRRLFYAVMRLGERIDLWLNLHGVLSKDDVEGKDGLFGASKAGSNTMLGQLEQIVRGGDTPRAAQRDEDLTLP